MSVARLLSIAFVAGCASGAGTPDAAIDAVPPPDVMIDSSINYCISTDTCENTNVLGSVSGDTGNMKLMAAGFQAAWLRVRVTEDDGSFGGRQLKLRLRLTSPSSVGFDVFGYVNTATDVLECTTPTGTATSSGSDDVLDLTWGELGGANGNSDSRYVAIEIRPTTLGCTTTQQWALEVQGNPP